VANNYCQACGCSMMPTLRICPQCGGRVFSSVPPARPVAASSSEGRTPGANSSSRQVKFGDAISLFFKNFFNFEGRSSRGAYWWFFLAATFINLVVFFVVSPIPASSGASQVALLLVFASLFFVIGGLALSIRRLHDTNRTCWWLLIGLLPIIGPLVLIVLFCTPGTRGPNSYGPDVEAGR